MIKLKHTPGPWQYEITDETPNRLDIIIQASVGGKDIGWNYTIPDGEGEANARLIAAAPEMLEALIDAYLIFDGLNFEGVGNIKESIEKATGLPIEEILKEE